MKPRLRCLALAIPFLLSCAVSPIEAAATESAPPKTDLQAQAQRFLDLFGSLYQSAYTVAAEAQWKAQTDVTPEHGGERVAAGKAIAAIQGKESLCQKALKYK